MSNISCYRGDTAEWDVVVAKDGVPVDLTGATITMSTKRSVADTALIFQVTGTPDPDQVQNAGHATVKLLSTSTSSLPSDIIPLRYDIQVVMPDGDTWTVLAGVLTVTADISQ